jgi:hypothetical protein
MVFIQIMMKIKTVNIMEVGINYGTDLEGMREG